MLIQLKGERAANLPDNVDKNKTIHEVIVWDTDNEEDWYLVEALKDVGSVQIDVGPNIKRHYISEKFKGWECHYYAWVRANCFYKIETSTPLMNSELVGLLDKTL